VLRRSASVSGQVLGVLALIGLAVGLRRRRGLGPWWLWGMPVTALLATVVMVGGRLKRAPLDPFLIVLTALAIDAAAVCVQGAPRSTDKA
jgi:cytochrome c-type biogenesis protein CcmH/NrfF